MPCWQSYDTSLVEEIKEKFNVNAPAGRPLSAYDLGVVTLRALIRDTNRVGRHESLDNWKFSNAGYKSKLIATTTHDDEDVGDTGVEPKDIELVMTQAWVSRNDKGDGLFDLLLCVGEYDILV
nr:nascent polypeptide-associated complex subunit alpha-like protein 1 [Tanacetum cinerariifolium]